MDGLPEAGDPEAVDPVDGEPVAVISVEGLREAGLLVA